MSNCLPYLTREIHRWPDVAYEVDVRTKTHPRIVLKCGDEQRFLCYSKTRVQTRGIMNKVTELRRVLREIGAQRVHP